MLYRMFDYLIIKTWEVSRRGLLWPLILGLVFLLSCDKPSLVETVRNDRSKTSGNSPTDARYYNGEASSVAFAKAIACLMQYSGTNLWSASKRDLSIVRLALDQTYYPPDRSPPAYLCDLRGTNGCLYLLYVEAREGPQYDPVNIRTLLIPMDRRCDRDSEFLVGSGRTLFPFAIQGFEVVRRSCGTNDLSDLFIVKTSGEWCSKQYYAPYEQSLVLVRIEDKDGKGRFPDVDPKAGTSEIGLYPPLDCYERKYGSLRETLHNGSADEILSVLIYLIGKADSRHRYYARSNTEQDTYQRDVMLLIDKNTWSRLSEHSDLWVREYAELLRKTMLPSRAKSPQSTNESMNATEDADGKKK